MSGTEYIFINLSIAYLTTHYVVRSMYRRVIARLVNINGNQR